MFMHLNNSGNSTTGKLLGWVFVLIFNCVITPCAHVVQRMQTTPKHVAIQPVVNNRDRVAGGPLALNAKRQASRFQLEI